MIVDCVTFYNELDLLELRFTILEDAVDRFVVCEAPFTFRGEPKPLYLTENLARFARWRDRLTVLVYPGPASDDPWTNEHGQRAYLVNGIADCAPDAIALIGDCDEIPDPARLGERPQPGRILAHRMLLSHGWFNRIATGDSSGWYGTRAIACGDVAAYGGFAKVRDVPIGSFDEIESGWHFTSLGGAAAMARKMSAFSHEEFDIPYYTDLRRLEVSYESTYGTECVPLDERFPAAVRAGTRWSHYVAPPAPPADPETSIALEHAHGCFAYVGAGARRVAAITFGSLDLWDAVGRERFGERFAGAFPDADALLASATGADWIVVNPFERVPVGTLATLRASGTTLVAYCGNARSFNVFRPLISGHGRFPPGRALGHAEIARDVAAAGYRIVAQDRVLKRDIFWRRTTLPMLYGVSVGGVTFSEIAPDAFTDFLTNAFLLTLAPV